MTASEARHMGPLPAAVPGLRAFAIELCGQVDRADDLVHDTLPRALSNLHRFEPGSNLNAQPFASLCNLFHSEVRERCREVKDATARMRDGSTSSRNRHHTWISRIFAWRGPSCLLNSGWPCFWWQRPACPKGKLLISAAARSTRSRAESTGPARLAPSAQP